MTIELIRSDHDPNYKRPDMNKHFNPYHPDGSEECLDRVNCWFHSIVK